MSPGRPRVLVTRPAGQASELSALLRDSGCESVEVPSIAILPCEDWPALDAAIERLETYDWLLVTSRNAVEMLFLRLRIIGCEPPQTAAWAAIGPGTAAALAAHGVARAWMPSQYISDALADELPVRPGQRVLRFRAQEAADIAPRLRARGAVVDEVIVYGTVEAPPDSVALLRRAWDSGIDAVVLASASAARGFAALARAAGCNGVLEVPIVAIGPVTAGAASALGLRVETVAEEHSLPGIASAIQRRFEDAGHVRTP